MSRQVVHGLVRHIVQQLRPPGLETFGLKASLEQLVGTLSIEDALQSGAVRLSPGLVARAHQGVLYVDEVNLLPDALVDALLDVAASGVNTVERDGISQRHAARFVLVGTMNPEEGELRPQLLDRFGLSVWLHNPTDAAQRQQIVRSRLLFDADPGAVAESHADALQNLAASVTDPQRRWQRHFEWPRICGAQIERPQPLFGARGLYAAPD